MCRSRGFVVFLSAGVERLHNAASWLSSKRSGCQPQGDIGTSHHDTTAHLLCSNYWLQPIHQELLHSSSQYNATGNGEKNRPCNGLACISAHPWPPKKLKPVASGTRFTDWIGGVCYADTLRAVTSSSDDVRDPPEQGDAEVDMMDI